MIKKGAKAIAKQQKTTGLNEKYNKNNSRCTDAIHNRPY